MTRTDHGSTAEDPRPPMVFPAEGLPGLVGENADGLGVELVVRRAQHEASTFVERLHEVAIVLDSHGVESGQVRGQICEGIHTEDVQLAPTVGNVQRYLC